MPVLLFSFPKQMDIDMEGNSTRVSEEKRKRMAGERNWFGAIRRKFAKSSCKIITVTDEAAVPIEVKFWKENNVLTHEDVAAIKIQAFFRGHLARRAFRALRSLVKLQAVVRGVCVRRQTQVAMNCMRALVRLQVKVRARQLLSRSGDEQLLCPL